MWSDMNVAIEDLSTVNFILVRHNSGNNSNNNNNSSTASSSSSTKKSMPIPKVTGSRQSLFVYMPVPDYVYAMLPPSNGQSPLNRDQISFKVTPVINFHCQFYDPFSHRIFTFFLSFAFCYASGILQHWNQ
jgi:inositol polyphosphate-4-phosphatase